MDSERLRTLEAEWLAGQRTDWDYFPHLASHLAQLGRNPTWTLECLPSSLREKGLEVFGLQARSHDPRQIVLRDEAALLRERFGEYGGGRVAEVLQYARKAPSSGRGGQGVIGDPWMADLRLGNSSRPKYRSLGQRFVLHEVDDMHPGDVLVGILPTGEGKSLCIHRLCGLGSKDHLIVVVVPTVALALDQEAEARRVVPGLDEKNFSLAYRPGEEDADVGIRSRIEEGRQGILFASPEALTGTGKLYRPLMKAAREGKVKALVIDEAHMIDAWGMDFRIEFQLLSELRKDLMKAARKGVAPGVRTVLLSATLTQQNLNRIEERFDVDQDGAFSVVGSLRLRREAESVFLSTTEERRAQDVEFLVARLPRPLYVFATKREDVEAWYQRLKSLGCAKIGMCHGGTSRYDRERLLKGLRGPQRSIEVVVGNSAFGLGVNISDVRSVLHLCIPESLDRYYQEIGRAGRDGRAVAAVTLWTGSDQEIARSVGSKTLIGVDRGFQRWSAMQQSWQTRGESKLVRIGGQVVSNEAHREWDKKTLILLQLCKLVRVLGFEWQEGQQYALIRPRHPGLGKKATWLREVEPIRRELKQEAQEGIDSMMRILSDPEGLEDELAACYALKFHEHFAAPSSRGNPIRWRSKERHTDELNRLRVLDGLEGARSSEMERVLTCMVRKGFTEWRARGVSEDWIWKMVDALPPHQQDKVRFEDPKADPVLPWVEFDHSDQVDAEQLLLQSSKEPGTAILRSDARSTHPDRELKVELSQYWSEIDKVCDES